MVAILKPVHQKQSTPATVSPHQQGNPHCFHSNSPPDAQVVQNGEARVFNIQHSAKPAKEPNLTYEEAEDSEVEDDLGEGQMFGVFESKENLSLIHISEPTRPY